MTDKEIVSYLKGAFFAQSKAFTDVVIDFLDDTPSKIRIEGAKGDVDGTFHEWLFSQMFPHYQKQVSFGTGKGGYKKYFCKCYTADFVDEQRKEIIEIDGKSHNRRIHKIKDQLRTVFFQSKGYTVYRLKNEDVEQLAIKCVRSKFVSKQDGAHHGF